MRPVIWLCAGLLATPAMADPITATGLFTRCVSDSCEIVIEGVFAYVEGGAGTPTDLMIALYELADGPRALRLSGDITLREDGFADLILSEFTPLPDDSLANFAHSLQGRWRAQADAEDLIIDIDGLQWVEIRPQTARARWKLRPATQCEGLAPPDPGTMVFTLTPWRSEAERPGCWQVMEQNDSELKLRDLTRPQEPLTVLRAAP